MLTFHDPDCGLHNPTHEFHHDRLVPAFENQKRVEIILRHLREADLGPIVAPDVPVLEHVLRVHTPEYVDFLRHAHQQWVAQGNEGDAVPYVWPARCAMPRPGDSIHGQLGYFAGDSGTPIVAGTWRGASASAHSALAATASVHAGERVAYALGRPPGHHASADVYAGYCFLNNAAICAQYLRDQGRERVAVLDVDFHHGNGTQAIFWERADVLTVSLHGDPDREYPYHLGRADEAGSGPGEGHNLNIPLPPGTAVGDYTAALREGLARVEGFAPEALVVSVGFDTFETDPISSFRLRTEDFAVVAGMIAGLGLPTVLVQEGGYAVDELGLNAVTFLRAFDEAIPG